MPRPTLVHIESPRVAAVPLVVDSPHSGLQWPDDFRPAAPATAIRTTWDALVERLFGAAPDVGATLIHASFPRAYLDVNRAEDDLDPALLDAPWPTPLAPTDYSRRGMGLVRRLALPDVPMYDAPLPVADVARRLDTCYRPYRAAVEAALRASVETFGAAWYLDCHSMKSRGNAMNVDAGAPRPDVVVSDRHGTTADPAHTAWLAAWWRERGYVVQINTPYQGGDLVRTFGQPAERRHAMQIELNRALYLDERTAEAGPGFEALHADCTACLDALADYVRHEATRR